MATKTIKNNPSINIAKTSANEPSKKLAVAPKPNFAFTKENYRLMLVGIAAILIGFFVMSLDKEPHGFGFLGLTLGPIIVVSGFIFEFFAIFYKTKSEK
jgi:uncharacterized RDD family membrane protein YckC